MIRAHLIIGSLSLPLCQAVCVLWHVSDETPVPDIDISNDVACLTLWTCLINPYALLLLEASELVTHLLLLL